MFTANILRGPLVAAALALPGLSGAAISPALSETVRQLAQAQSQVVVIDFDPATDRLTIPGAGPAIKIFAQEKRTTPVAVRSTPRVGEKVV